MKDKEELPYWGMQWWAKQKNESGENPTRMNETKEYA